MDSGACSNHSLNTGQFKRKLSYNAILRTPIFSMDRRFTIYFRFIRSAFPITDAELRLMARAAIMGDSNQPVHGYNTPAAMGMPKPLYKKANIKFCFILPTVASDKNRATAIPRKSPFTKV